MIAKGRVHRNNIRASKCHCLLLLTCAYRWSLKSCESFTKALDLNANVNLWLSIIASTRGWGQFEQSDSLVFKCNWDLLSEWSGEKCCMRETWEQECSWRNGKWIQKSVKQLLPGGYFSPVYTLKHFFFFQTSKKSSSSASSTAWIEPVRFCPVWYRSRDKYFRCFSGSSLLCASWHSSCCYPLALLLPVPLTGLCFAVSNKYLQCTSWFTLILLFFCLPSEGMKRSLS